MAYPIPPANPLLNQAQLLDLLGRGVDQAAEVRDSLGQRVTKVIGLLLLTPLIAMIITLGISILAIHALSRAITGKPIVPGLLLRIILPIKFYACFQSIEYTLKKALGLQRAGLDEAINSSHLDRSIAPSEIPEPPPGVQLEKLVDFGRAMKPPIDLTRFVTHIQTGCQAGVYPDGTEFVALQLAPEITKPAEVEKFTTRLQRLVHHVTYLLQHGNCREGIRIEVLRAFEDAQGLCAPRHMTQSESAYRRLGQSLPVHDLTEEICLISQTFREAILHELNSHPPHNGQVHDFNAMLQALGEEFSIPGYNPDIQDPSLITVDLDLKELRKDFLSKYTAEALVKRISLAVNEENIRDRELSSETLQEWFRENIPVNYHLPFDIQLDEDDDIDFARKIAYLTREVLEPNSAKIKPEAIRYMLIKMGVLNGVATSCERVKRCVVRIFQIIARSVLTVSGRIGKVACVLVAIPIITAIAIILFTGFAISRLRFIISGSRPRNNVADLGRALAVANGLRAPPDLPA